MPATDSTTQPASTAPLPYRHELFAQHVARGAGLAQAVRLAGYSPQGARQRGCVLMADPAVRRRVETLRQDWMAERARHAEEAIGQLRQIAEMALRGDSPTTAMNAVLLQLKLRGVVQDSRAGLYASSPDDDLAKALFDPREDEDPPLDPPTPPEPAVLQAPEPIATAPAPSREADEVTLRRPAQRDVRPPRRLLH
jgi:hypothetical protein